MLDHYCNLMNRYVTDNLVGISPQDFERRIEEFRSITDFKMEGYQSAERQRPKSVAFHWGHDHDFGTFKIQGAMGMRHVSIPAAFATLGAFPDMKGKKVLDIGVWTGGTSLLYAAMGALKVVAVEEVKKYAATVDFLQRSFGIQNLTVLDWSLYELNSEPLRDQFDVVCAFGVIYHVTDPIVALRIMFNCLKDGGVLLIESARSGESSPVCGYHGPTATTTFNWFVPSVQAMTLMLYDVGFADVDVWPSGNRLFAKAHRTKHVDMNRAGLSVRHLP